MAAIAIGAGPELGAIEVHVDQAARLEQWPAGDGPAEVGETVASHFVTSPHQYTESIHYSEVVAWYGALTFAGATHDTVLRDARRIYPTYEALM